MGRTVTVNADKPGIGADLGAELRRRREAAGIGSQQELAGRLHCDRTLITKIETGKSVPTDDMVEAWAGECDFDPVPYLVLARHARRPGIAPQWFESWLEIEPLAKLIRVWSPMLVPGPLQTEDYARTLFTEFGADEDTMAGFIEMRLGRRARFSSARVIVLLDEAALYSHMIGSPAIMADQLQHVLDVTVTNRLTAQVVPSKRAACGLSGAFDIASGDSFPDTVRMDAVADQVTDRHAVVEQAAVIFDQLRGYAWSRDQSRDMIMEALSTWRARASADGSARAAIAATAAATASS